MIYFDNEKTPYNDQEMTWNSSKRRYILTVDAVDNAHFIKTPFETACGDQDIAESRLDEISADMYKYIYKYNRRDEKKRRVVEYRLSKDDDIRETLKESMLDMVRALIRSGYSLQKDLGWVNTITGTVFDYRNIPSIAPDAIDGLFARGLLLKSDYTFRISDDDYRSDY